MKSDRRWPVAIVGAGFSGTLTAAQLARKGIATVLVEGGGIGPIGGAGSQQHDFLEVLPSPVCLAIFKMEPLKGAALITLDEEARPGWLDGHGRPADLPMEHCHTVTVIDGSTAWEKVISLTPDPQGARSELKRIVVRDENPNGGAGAGLHGEDRR